MAKSDLFPFLADIDFAVKDPDIITSEIIGLYENISGRTLAQADPVRLFLNALILVIIQQRNIIDNAAKQNLLAYASGHVLDHIGILLGVVRLEPAHAVATMRARLQQVLDYDAVIPSGTRIQAGEVMFATTQQAVISAGQLSTEIPAQCQTAGVTGNGYAIGQVKKLADVLPFGVEFENITETHGGTDSESDEALRERIHIAPESFSTAGPVKAYEYFAKSANSDIIDVAVASPPVTEPGCVKIYPLMTGGTLPSAEVLDEVRKTCTASDVRPDTDFVEVLSPEPVNYELDMTYWIDEKNSASSEYIRESAENAAEKWTQWQRQALGRDINPSELIRLVVEAGAKRCEVRKPEFRVLKDWEAAMCTQSRVIYGGLERG